MKTELIEAAAKAIARVEWSTEWNDFDVEGQNSYREDGRAVAIAILRTLYSYCIDCGSDGILYWQLDLWATQMEKDHDLRLGQSSSDQSVQTEH